MEAVKALPKRGACRCRNQPLPVPMAGCCPEVPVKSSYCGYLRGKCVVIPDPEEAEMLHAHGFFGKKTLVVPAPKEHSEPKKARLLNPFDVPCSETLSKRRYKRRLGWIDADIGYGEGSSGWQLRVDDCLVHEDTDLEDAPGEFDSNLKSVEKCSLPCRVLDGLQLCPEEVMFLASELRCLNVLEREEASIPVTVDDLWRFFCGNDNVFLARYASYLHLRAKGWVVKPGLKFGVDWLLYKQGPAYYHASMAVKVVVQDLSPPSSNSSRKFLDVPFSEMRRMTRLSSVVSKNLVYLTVFLPSSVSHPPVMKDVRSVGVTATFVHRWKGSSCGDVESSAKNTGRC